MRTEEGAKEILRGARELVEKGWCQGAYARGAEGQAVDMYGATACSFCVLGAVDSFNDHPQRTKDDMLQLFDDAIELARSGE